MPTFLACIRVFGTHKIDRSSAALWQHMVWTEFLHWETVEPFMIISWERRSTRFLVLFFENLIRFSWGWCTFHDYLIDIKKQRDFLLKKYQLVIIIAIHDIKNLFFPCDKIMILVSHKNPFWLRQQAYFEFCSPQQRRNKAAGILASTLSKKLFFHFAK